MCDVWREPKEEIAATHWINALIQLKKSIGTYKVSFAGGEVLLKEGAFDIFEACNKHKIPWGITTNGVLLTKGNVQRLLSYRPYNINISLDSLDEATYERIRGISSLSLVKNNIDHLAGYRKRDSLGFKVTLKTVVNELNLAELPSLARYATAKGLTGIMFDPIKRRRTLFIEKKVPEFEAMMDIKNDRLQEAKERLITLKRQGYRILNSERNINQWFREEEYTDDFFCTIPLQRLYISNTGDVKLCDFTEQRIGNITKDEITRLLVSEQMGEQKKDLPRCKAPCVYCARRHVSDYLSMIFRYGR